MAKKKRKVNTKRIAIVALIPVVCIALMIANFTSIRLSIKGYHKEDKKVVLELEKEDIKDILQYDQIINISKLLFCKWVVIIRLFTMFRAHCIPISHFFWR